MITNSEFFNSPNFKFDANSLALKGNLFNTLFLTGSRIGMLSSIANYIHERFMMGFTNVDYVILDSNRFQYDKANYFITNSTIKGFSVHDHDSAISDLSFMMDTLSGPFQILRPERRSHVGKSAVNAIFSQCQLDCQFSLDIIKPDCKTTLQFRACHFGPGTSLFNVSIDTIEFENCLAITNPVPLSVGSSRNVVWLKLFNTDPSNIKFDYLGRIRLFLWDDNETNTSNYENLIAKFQNEKKEESLKNIRIEFYRYSHNSVSSFLNAIWWWYGYHKGLILIWTLGFLVLFYLINHRNWEKMQELYPIMEKDKPSYYERVTVADNAAAKKRVKVLAFTSLIFFSLRIDFDKLSFQKPSLIIYFFIQYLVGLGCLFFIFNAILKI